MKLLKEKKKLRIVNPIFIKGLQKIYDLQSKRKFYKTVTDWCIDNRKISKGYSSKIGNFEPYSYQKPIFDSFTDPNVKTIVVVAGTQLVKTEFLLNSIGYIISNSQGSIIVLLPTDDSINYFNERLESMIESSNLEEYFLTPFDNKSGYWNPNTKRFFGGTIYLLNSQSIDQLSARSVKYIFKDEIDKMKDTRIGDPIELINDRSQIYEDKKIIEMSSPTIENSKIDVAFKTSNMQYYFCKCPHCDHEQYLEFKNLKFQFKENDLGKDLIRESIYYQCEKGCQIFESDKEKFVNLGRYIEKNKNHSENKIGFKLNSLISFLVPWSDLINQFDECKNTPSKLKVFTNSKLAENFKEIEMEANQDVDVLYKRRQAPPKNIYYNSKYIICGVDIQGNRVELVCWSFDPQPFCLDYQIFKSDDLMFNLNQAFSYFKENNYDYFCVDTGFETLQIYEFKKMILRQGNERGKQIVLVKGIKERINLINKSQIEGTDLYLYTIDVFKFKKDLFYCLQIQDPTSPSYINFADHLGLSFFNGLLSEILDVRESFDGTKKYFFKRIRANEVLDCTIYSFAFFHYLSEIEKYKYKRPSLLFKENDLLERQINLPKQDNLGGFHTPHLPKNPLNSF